MKKLTLILFILIISCKEKNYKNQTLTFSQIDEKGGSTSLYILIDDAQKVSGGLTYLLSEKLNSKIIDGRLIDDEILGTSYDESTEEESNFKITIYEDYATYIEEGKSEIKLKLDSIEKDENIDQSSEVKQKKAKEKSINCDNEKVLNHVTEILRKNGVRGAKVIKGFTIRKDDETANCDCEARLEGEYWIKDGSAPLDRHLVKEPKVRFSIYKDYEGETMIEVTYSEI